MDIPTKLRNPRISCCDDRRTVVVEPLKGLPPNVEQRKFEFAMKRIAVETLSGALPEHFRVPPWQATASGGRRREQGFRRIGCNRYRRQTRVQFACFGCEWQYLPKRKS